MQKGMEAACKHAGTLEGELSVTVVLVTYWARMVKTAKVNKTTFYSQTHHVLIIVTIIFITVIVMIKY